jgi:hypothetical protein
MCCNLGWMMVSILSMGFLILISLTVVRRRIKGSFWWRYRSQRPVRGCDSNLS